MSNMKSFSSSNCSMHQQEDLGVLLALLENIAYSKKIK